MTAKTKTSRTKHKPPSRLRYEAAHPVVSFRVSREVHERLQDLLARSGKSIGDFFREALQVQQTNTNRVYQRGYQRGSQDAKGSYRVIYRCDVCGGGIEIVSTNAKAAAARYMEECGWGHESCHQVR